MLEIASVCDYVVAARQFALDLGWDGSPDGLFPISDRLGPAVLTVTLGNRGSLTRFGERIIHIPAFPVPEVDTTGAGDVFHGGFIFGLLKGLDLTDTIRFASALAALKCTRIGGRAGIPPLDETASFLKRNGWSFPL
jgi:ribokinase